MKGVYTRPDDGCLAGTKQLTLCLVIDLYPMALLVANATSLFASSFSSLPETLAPVWLPPHAQAQDTLVDALEILNVSSKDVAGKETDSAVGWEEWVVAVFGECLALSF
jgi:hypothetical protein